MYWSRPILVFLFQLLKPRGGIFIGAQEAVPILNTLIKLGHQQPTSGTLIETDNSTAHDLLTVQVPIKQYSDFDMQYYWIKNRITQSQCYMYWAHSTQSHGDYLTNHHPPSHNQLMHPLNLHTACHVSHMQGCVGSNVITCTLITLHNEIAKDEV